MNSLELLDRKPATKIRGPVGTISGYQKSANFLILFLAAMLVYYVGGYWAVASPGIRGLIKTGLPILLLGLTWICGRHEPLRPWRSASLALLAASSGFLVSWWVSDPLLAFFGVQQSSVSGIALSKLSDSTLIVLPAVLVARAGGLKFKDLYLRKGNARAWLAVGGAGFAVFTGIFLVQAAEASVTANQLAALAPWVLIFVFSNGFMEELHFRGLLLKPFERLLGAPGANLCIALCFTLIHAPVEYVPEILPFLAIVFVLALLWGFIIQRTESLWGAVLFHAGADLMIMVSIFQTYGAGLA